MKALIKATFTMVVDMRNDFDPEGPFEDEKDWVEFWANGSSACMERLVRQLVEEEEAVGEGCCFTCHRLDVEYLREATEDDEERYTPNYFDRYR